MEKAKDPLIARYELAKNGAVSLHFNILAPVVDKAIKDSLAGLQNRASIQVDDPEGHLVATIQGPDEARTAMVCAKIMSSRFTAGTLGAETKLATYECADKKTYLSLLNELKARAKSSNSKIAISAIINMSAQIYRE